MGEDASVNGTITVCALSWWPRRVDDAVYIIDVRVVHYRLCGGGIGRVFQNGAAIYIIE